MKFFIIKKRNEIISAKNFTSSVTNKYFSIKYNKECSNGVLIINTKKNCKTSVKRNQLKRRIKEILRITDFTGTLVIYSRPPAFKASFSHIKEHLQNLIYKI